MKNNKPRPKAAGQVQRLPIATGQVQCLAKGFAALSPEQRRQIASMGGRAAQRKGTAHRFDHDEAVAAGRKGGKAAQERGTGYRWNSKTGKAASRERRRH